MDIPDSTGQQVGRGVMAAGGFVVALGGLALALPHLGAHAHLMVAGVVVSSSLCFAVGGSILALGAGIHRSAVGRLAERLARGADPVDRLNG